MMKILKVNKSSLKSRTINIPGDKSISHRAIILLSLASNSSTIRGLLEAEDCLHTIRIMQELGVKIYKQGEEYIIEGVGLNGLTKPKKELYCGNSGTAMRLISGILAGQDFESKLTGDTSLLSRPMERVSEPLKLMGANLTLEKKEKAPINFKPAKLTGINYEMNIDSAQQKSLIILASMYANSQTRIKQKNLTRDHTENLLKYFDYDININQQYIEINPNKKLCSKNIDIPSDCSSAMFFIVAALVSKNSQITIKNVCLNKYRTGAIEILKRMGGKIIIENIKTSSFETIGDITAKSSSLVGIEIPNNKISDAIDEFPVIFIAAANAKGVTTLKDAQELRVKESDRLLAMSNGLNNCGIQNKLFKDGISIQGGEFKGGEVNAYGDHRIAMSFVVSSLISKDSIKIIDTKNIDTSFPNFIELAKQCGFIIHEY